MALKKEKKPCKAATCPDLQGKSVESLMKSINVCRSVGLEITNRTRTVILRDFRTYCFSGRNMIPMPFEIPPDSRGSCIFAKTPYSLRGSVGLLTCKANPFTLAIMFSNPFDYVIYKIEFALEIFRMENHINLSSVYSDMMRKKPHCGSSLFQRAKLESEQETLEVSSSNIRVKAKMSNNEKAILKVQVEDIDPPPYCKDV